MYLDEVSISSGMSTADKRVIYVHNLQSVLTLNQIIKPATVLTETCTQRSVDYFFLLFLLWRKKESMSTEKVSAWQGPQEKKNLSSPLCSLFHSESENMTQDSLWAQFNWLCSLCSRCWACTIFTQPPQTGTVSRDGMYETKTPIGVNVSLQMRPWCLCDLLFFVGFGQKWCQFQVFTMYSCMEKAGLSKV